MAAICKPRKLFDVSTQIPLQFCYAFGGSISVETGLPWRLLHATHAR